MKPGAMIRCEGANRRADMPVIETVLSVTPDEALQLQQGIPVSAIAVLHSYHAVLAPLDTGLAVGSVAQLGELTVQVAVSLQQAANHLVSQHGVIDEGLATQCRVWFEYDHPDTGEAAALLAVAVVNTLLAAQSDVQLHSIAQDIDDFVRSAKAAAMPLETRAILNAAMRRDIPVIRMDRPPFEPIAGAFRVRRNALLRLGHGNRQETVDGSFCVSRNEALHALIRDRQALFQQLRRHGIALPSGSDGPWCTGAVQTGRAAERLGYPVFLRASRRGIGASGPLHSRDAVRAAAQTMLRQDTQIGVQPVMPGTQMVVLLGGITSWVALEPVSGSAVHQWQDVPHPDPAALAIVLRVAHTLDCGLIAITLAAAPAITATDQARWSVLDVELAPALDTYLEPGPRVDTLATALVDWLYPDPAMARIPLIAVTGTNGKTTTSRLLERILTAAGYCTGMACSDGSMIAGETVSDNEDGHFVGHILVVNDARIDAAVLESTRAAAAGTGLGFSRCSVSVCLNVTADHLNDELGTHTLQQLADVKRGIVDRARDAVVLNADDPVTLAMAAQLPGRKIGLVTLDDPARFAAQADAAAGVIDGESEPWLCLRDSEQHHLLLPVRELPISHEGRAAHNVSNALHAALAAHLLGVDATAITAGLRSLTPSYAQTPGRLNPFGGFPFTLYLDYAHNPAGVAALTHFAMQLPVSGRRILCFSCSNQNSDELIRATAAATKGLFDYYICKNFSKLFDRRPAEGPALLREGLLSAGVADNAIECIPDELLAIDRACSLGRAGDLVIVVGGKRRQHLVDHILKRAAEQPEACGGQA